LVAEGVGVVLSLIVTYAVVEQLLRWRDRRTWRTARSRLLSRLFGVTNHALLIWAFVARPNLTNRLVESPKTTLDEIASELESELADLTKSFAKVPDNRANPYWKRNALMLGHMTEELFRVVDRTELAIERDPRLVSLVSDLEDASSSLQAFAMSTETFEHESPPGHLLMMAADTIKVLTLYSRLRTYLKELMGSDRR